MNVNQGRQVVMGGEEFTMPTLSKRMVGFIVLIVLGLILLFTTFYKVGADEVAVIRRFGRYRRTTEPGLHLKWPFGIETVKKPKVKKNFTQEFGFRTIKPGVLTKIRRTGYGDESLMLTGDLNVGVVEWIVQYKIEDPKAFIFNVREPEETIRDIAEVAMRLSVGDGSVDEVLTFGKMDIAEVVRERLQTILDSYELGIQIILVALQDVNPPDKVKPAFDEVNSAMQDKDRLIQEARREYNEVVPRAEGEAEKMIKEAEGYAVERVNTARGDGQRFLALWGEYRKAKDVTRRRLYLETLSEAIPKLEKKYIVDDGVEGLMPLLGIAAPEGGGK
jgi:membrane protease subunit HflK